MKRVSTDANNKASPTLQLCQEAREGSGRSAQGLMGKVAAGAILFGPRQIRQAKPVRLFTCSPQGSWVLLSRMDKLNDPLGTDDVTQSEPFPHWLVLRFVSHLTVASQRTQSSTARGALSSSDAPS